jgi:hypothetical protein
VLERNVEVGEDDALGHERDELVHGGVWVDIVEADPGAEAAEFAGDIGEVGANGRAPRVS